MSTLDAIETNTFKTDLKRFTGQDTGISGKPSHVATWLTAIGMVTLALLLGSLFVLAKHNDKVLESHKQEISQELALIERERVAFPDSFTTPRKIALGEVRSGHIATLTIPEIFSNEELPTVELLAQTITYEKP